MSPSLACCLIALLTVRGTADDRGGWQYVVPPPGDRHASGPPQAVMLGDVKPADVEEKVAYRGASRRYGQIRYGTENSTRVTVVADRLASGEVDLYMDTDRNRVVESDERLPNAGASWRVALSAERIDTPEEPEEYIDRTVLVRLTSSGRTLLFATAGYLDGEVEVADRRMTARRFDADGNGRFADPDDRLWIDLNRDGKWNPFGEQFPCNPIVKLGESRYVVKTDAAGDNFALEPLAGTGQIRLAVLPRDEKSRVKQLRALLVGRDGSAVAIRDASAITVPVNEYRISSLSLVLSDAHGGHDWSYAFSYGYQSKARWHKLETDQTLVIEPLAAMRMGKDALDGRKSCRPGHTLIATPRVNTADGLIITTCWRGDRSNPTMDGVGAGITLSGPDGSELAKAHSGFS